MAHLAVSAVLAGSLLALVLHPRLAVPPGESNGAGAGVVLARVEAGGAVVARSVLGAEVEVDVAEVAAPAAVAVAGVGPAAGAVLAARVDLALVALGSCPSYPAPGKEAFVRRRSGKIVGILEMGRTMGQVW